MIRPTSAFRSPMYRPMGSAGAQQSAAGPNPPGGMMPVTPIAPSMDPGLPPMGGALQLLQGLGGQGGNSMMSTATSLSPALMVAQALMGQGGQKSLTPRRR